MRGTFFPILMVVIGVALIVRMAIIGTILGIILGLLFIAAGAGRLYLERRP
jgi:ABC-type amino acid transport system permease subunit